MGTVALPQMKHYGYNKSISLGSILAGGTLAQLIPPSVMIILYCMVTQLSVGRMFAGGIAAGIILSGIFITYVLVRAYLQKELCPALPPEDRVSLREKIVSLRALVLPSLLILGVLGSIFSGAATPTEAAAVGAGGVILSAAVLRRLNWPMLSRSMINSLRVSGMVGWLLVASYAFSAVFFATKAGDLVESTLLFLGGSNKWGVLAVMMLLLFIAGMFMELIVVVLVGAPLMVPIIQGFGFDPVWFGILFMVMLQMGYISPPFGFSLFYLAGVAPSDVTTTDIYKGAIPFLGLQMVGLLIFIIIPMSFMWFPNLLFG
jgi:tripartite ATP-independent transporter DctM subunit